MVERAKQVWHGLYLGMNANPWQAINVESATQQHPLGAFFDDHFGRRFRYALNSSAAALVAGNIVQGATLGGASTTLQSTAAVAAAAAAGAKRVYLNAITTAQAAELYAEGWAGIWDNDLTAVYTHRIKDNNALATSGGTGYIDLYDELKVALTTSDKVALQVNPYRDIIVAPTTVTGKILGGVHCAVTASYYCWVQTRGIFAARLKDVSTNIGVGPIGAAGTTAGSIINPAEAGSGAYKQVFGQSFALWLDEYAALVELQCE